MIYLVCGSPLSGKTYYVKKNKYPSDLVIDWDELYKALTYNDKYDRPNEVFKAIDIVRGALLDNLDKIRLNCWVITTTKKHIEIMQFKKKYNCEIIYIKSSIRECLKHLTLDKERNKNYLEWENIVKLWFASCDYKEKVLK